jgi:TIR domain
MTDVFISYTRADGDIASAIADHLQAAGLSVSLDISVLVPGEQFSERISADLAEAKAIILLLSSHSKRDGWVQTELIEALQKGDHSRVFPILLDSGAKENSIWPIVADRQAIEFSERDAPANIKTVAELVVGQIKRSNNDRYRLLTEEVYIGRKMIVETEKDHDLVKINNIELKGDFSDIIYISPRSSIGHRFNWSTFSEGISDQVLGAQLIVAIERLVPGLVRRALSNRDLDYSCSIANHKRDKKYTINISRITQNQSSTIVTVELNLIQQWQETYRNPNLVRLINSLLAGIEVKSLILDENSQYSLSRLKFEVRSLSELKTFVVDLTRGLDLISIHANTGHLEDPFFIEQLFPKGDAEIIVRSSIETTNKLYEAAQYVLRSNPADHTHLKDEFINALSDYVKITERINHEFLVGIIRMLSKELDLDEKY